MGLGPIWHNFFFGSVSITLYKTIPEPFSQLAKSSFVFNAGNWWLSQISWLTDATNHKKNVSHVLCEKKEMIQIQSSKICPNISDTVNSSRPYEKTSFYFLIFYNLLKNFPPLLFGWKNFERELRWELFKKSICLVNHLVKVDIYGSTNTNKANIEKLWPIRDVFGVKKKCVVTP